MFSPFSFDAPNNPRAHGYDRRRRTSQTAMDPLGQLFGGLADMFSDLDMANARHHQHAQTAHSQRQREAEAHRQHQQEARRHEEAQYREAVRRREEAQRHQEAQRREEARHREETQRREAARRREEARLREDQRIWEHQQRDAADAIEGAFSAAFGFVEQLFSDDHREAPAQQRRQRPQPQTESSTAMAHRARSAQASQAHERDVPVPTVTPVAPGGSVPTPPSAGPASPIHVPIYESKGKGPSHVQINLTPSASSSSSSEFDADTSPADSIAALTMLSTDLDSLLSASHIWQSDVHRRHALIQLLEQVDAVQSGGNDAVRDVRRGLVRRVERALDGLSDEQPPKEKAFEIHEPELSTAPAPDTPIEIAPSLPAFPLISAPVDEPRGHNVPELPKADTEPVAERQKEDAQNVVSVEVMQVSSEKPTLGSTLAAKTSNLPTSESRTDIPSDSSALDALAALAAELSPLAVVAGDHTINGPRRA
ncbi:hypothetical protein BKA62DRAFT_670913 [Auriculariales sp. MPI-PUGE-AT-0066]|nr:hypothetical protein BKA62DRAFT_670913 [Auriculariales sp. MPI-PUGE-AT-0066]